MSYQNSIRRSGGGNWYPSDRSFDAYNRSLKRIHSNDVEAFQLNCVAAEKGMHDAVLAMGWFYECGIGVEKDIAEAIRWYKKSARQGEVRAMSNLGLLYYQADDFAEALGWLERAVKQGHPRAKYLLARMYWRGQGVKQNRKLARTYFDEAAASNVKEAQRIVRFLSYVIKADNKLI